MQMKEEKIGDVVVISLKGNLMGDPETSELREKIYSCIGRDDVKIVLDLSKIKWMNSSGLGALISSLTSVKNKGGEIRLANITEKVQSLFMITQLVRVFKSYDSVEEAVNSFKTEPMS